MKNEDLSPASVNQDFIENKILRIRGMHVMLDSDLAQLYQVETKVLNQAVKRNIERFPDTFRFQLTEEEYNKLKTISESYLKDHPDSLRSQFVTLENKRGKHRKYLPYVFSEQGVAMLSAVLRSKIAVSVSIQIINVFVQMRKLIGQTSMYHVRFDNIEKKLVEQDYKINKIFAAIENKELPSRGIFFNGQIFDAWVFVSELVKSAEKEIVLIDNYVDETVLLLLNKRKEYVKATIYTQNISKSLALDIRKHNSQYQEVTVKAFKDSHDRFMIIDQKDLYHIGASLKDLGKKWFAFSKMNIDVRRVLGMLEG